ncbi:hypothetical protein D3C85_1928290 [compost metagenome]
MYAMNELKKVFESYGFENIQFLNIYHPFKFVTTGNGEGLFSNTLSTSFAIKGSKKID